MRLGEKFLLFFWATGSVGRISQIPSPIPTSSNAPPKSMEPLHYQPNSASWRSLLPEGNRSRSLAASVVERRPRSDLPGEDVVFVQCQRGPLFPIRGSRGSTGRGGIQEANVLSRSSSVPVNPARHQALANVDNEKKLDRSHDEMNAKADADKRS